MLVFPVVTVFIFAIFLLEMHVSGKRPCYIYFKKSFPVLQRLPKLTSLPTPTPATKVSLEPRLVSAI